MLADPVGGTGMGTVNDATVRSIQNLKGANHRTARKVLDLESASGHLLHALRKHLQVIVQRQP
jgi:hypothetical protein